MKTKKMMDAKPKKLVDARHKGMDVHGNANPVLSSIRGNVNPVETYLPDEADMQAVADMSFHVHNDGEEHAHIFMLNSGPEQKQ